MKTKITLTNEQLELLDTIRSTGMSIQDVLRVVSAMIDDYESINDAIALVASQSYVDDAIDAVDMADRKLANEQ